MRFFFLTDTFIDFHESETICTRDQAYHQRSTYMHPSMPVNTRIPVRRVARPLDVCYNMRSRPTRVAERVNTHAGRCTCRDISVYVAMNVQSAESALREINFAALKREYRGGSAK